MSHRTQERPITLLADASFAARTSQILTALETRGFRQVSLIVFETPGDVAARSSTQVIDRPPTGPATSLPTDSPIAPPTSPGEFASAAKTCGRLGFRYAEIERDDIAATRRILEPRPAEIALSIGPGHTGNRDLIDVFELGIIEVFSGRESGSSSTEALGQFVELNALPGTTVHFAGLSPVRSDEFSPEIFFQCCDLQDHDGWAAVCHRLDLNELAAWERLLDLLLRVPMPKRHLSEPRESVGPCDTGHPHDPARKAAPIDTLFESWKRGVLERQAIYRGVFLACETGDRETLISLLTPERAHLRNNFGRTPLMVAAYHQRIDCARLLIAAGADVNASNDNGTTVLMYAKTNLIHQADRSFELVELLIESGADRYQKDLYGEDVFYYIEAKGDPLLGQILKELGS